MAHRRSAALNFNKQAYSISRERRAPKPALPWARQPTAGQAQLFSLFLYPPVQEGTQGGMGGSNVVSEYVTVRPELARYELRKAV